MSRPLPQKDPRAPTTPTHDAVGRLAPSPTGELHLGNLSSLALAWVRARHVGARLILRIEDLDPPRCVDGAERQIVEDLRWLGVEWDEGPELGGALGPYRQSDRGERYRETLEALRARDLVYPCFCSRRDIRDVLSAPHSAFDSATQYPGTCAKTDEWARARSESHAVRFRARGLVHVNDQVFGHLCHDLATIPGDFVLRRRDDLYAYQFAVVVDDAAMGVTEVVRGHDLLDSTPRQFALFDALGADRPYTWHVPLLMDERGERLSKRARSISRPGLEAAGWDPAEVRGLLGWLWGWFERPEPVSIPTLIGAWDAKSLAQPIIRVPDATFEGPARLRELAGEEPGDQLPVE